MDAHFHANVTGCAEARALLELSRGVDMCTLAAGPTGAAGGPFGGVGGRHVEWAVSRYCARACGACAGQRPPGVRPGGRYNANASVLSEAYFNATAALVDALVALPAPRLQGTERHGPLRRRHLRSVVTPFRERGAAFESFADARRYLADADRADPIMVHGGGGSVGNASNTTAGGTAAAYADAVRRVSNRRWTAARVDVAAPWDPLADRATRFRNDVRALLASDALLAKPVHKKIPPNTSTCVLQSTFCGSNALALRTATAPGSLFFALLRCAPRRLGFSSLVAAGCTRGSRASSTRARAGAPTCSRAWGRSRTPSTRSSARRPP